MRTIAVLFHRSRSMHRVVILAALALLNRVPRQEVAAQATCKDGTVSEVSGRGACSSHGGVDRSATKAAKRADKATRGGTLKYRAVVCADGTSAAFGREACARHGGIAQGAGAATPAPTPTPLPRRVRAPRTADRSSQSTGATARCRDGSLSYSAHRQGTCSHHGGVAQWNP